MERTVLRHAPNYWNTIYVSDEQFTLNTSSEEYVKIKYQVQQAVTNNNLHISQIQRVQNVHDYGQFLIREQLMAIANSHKKYYRVRRFVTIGRQYLTPALEYNLDHRRCGMANLILSKNIDDVRREGIILAVQVITDTPGTDYIQPASSSEYFIDYIIHT